MYACVYIHAYKHMIILQNFQLYFTLEDDLGSNEKRNYMTVIFHLVIMINRTQILHKLPESWDSKFINNESNDVIISFIITWSTTAQYFLQHSKDRDRTDVRICTVIKVTAKVACEDWSMV